MQFGLGGALEEFEATFAACCGAGQCAEMNPIAAIARQHGLKIVEDAAQAHGAAYHGKRAGAFADAAAFSF